MKKQCAGIWAGIAASFLLSSPAVAEWGLNLRPGVTDISQEVYGLHMLIFYICCAIAVVVFGAIFYSILKHRKSVGHEAASFHHSTTLEIIWTVIPFIILISMVVPAAKTLIAMEDTSNSDVTIKITGYQWKWKYDYMDGDAKGISFFSNMSTPKDQIEGIAEKGENYLLEVDNAMVVPVGKKVRFLITAADVLHAWWMPDFAIKQDAIPGFINEAWTIVNEPGVYRGQCAELCGKDHGFMPIEVVALEEGAYLDWAAEQKAASAARAAAESVDKEWTKADLMAKGETVYGKVCAACHQGEGQGIPGVFPAITASPIATGPVEEHMNIVLNGKAGTAMQAFSTQLSPVELAAVLTFQRNGLGNSTGDLVQPKQIQANR